MDARRRWQALQRHLAAARAFLDANEPGSALEEVERALAIDPDFLAAHSIRERIAALGVYSTLGNGVRRSPQSAVVPLAALPATPAVDGPPPGVGAHPEHTPIIEPLPPAALNARAAVGRAAVEADDLDLPIVRPAATEPAGALYITAELARTITPDFTPPRAPRRHVGRWVAGVATLAIGVFGASYLDDAITSGGLKSYVIFTGAVLPQTEPRVLGDPSDTTEPADAIGTMGGAVVMPQPPTEPIRLAPTRPAVDVPHSMSAPPVIAEAPPPVASALPAPPPPAFTPPAAVPMASAALVQPVSLPGATAIVPEPRVIHDEEAIRGVLQRYRSAYDDLNARSARTVWPGVDERALARAFDGLSSQRLTFDACDVRLNGDSAMAICKGTAQYVAKVGSGEAQVEPRTWRFSLRRAGGGLWSIDSARAER